MSSAAEANARVASLGVRREYPAPVEVVPGLVLKPLERVGYASTILGRPCWIANDMRNAVPKRREDCTPFTYTLVARELPEGATWLDESCGRYGLPDGKFGYAATPDVKAQEKFVSGLAKLERAEARAAKARIPKVAPARAAKVATVRMRAGAVLEVVGLPRGYSFQVEEVN